MILPSATTSTTDEEKVNYRHALNSIIQSAYGTDNAKRSLVISKELASLRVSLPSLFHGSIWLRVDESRVDVLKACIAGPEGESKQTGRCGNLLGLLNSILIFLPFFASFFRRFSLRLWAFHVRHLPSWILQFHSTSSQDHHHQRRSISLQSKPLRRRKGLFVFARNLERTWMGRWKVYPSSSPSLDSISSDGCG